MGERARVTTDGDDVLGASEKGATEPLVIHISCICVHVKHQITSRFIAGY